MGYRLAKGHLYKDFSKDIFWEELYGKGGIILVLRRKIYLCFTDLSKVSYFLGIKGVDEPPGITHSKLSHPPMTSPQCLWMRSLSGTDISSSTC